MKKLFVLFPLILAACVSGHCRKLNQPDALPGEEQQAPPTAHVFIFKPDGSLQCHEGKRIGLDDMKSQLKTIQVFSQERKKDGLMHTQVCGTTTGFANVYEIFDKDLPAAEALGFKKWLY